MISKTNLKFYHLLRHGTEQNGVSQTQTGPDGSPGMDHDAVMELNSSSIPQELWQAEEVVWYLTSALSNNIVHSVEQTQQLHEQKEASRITRNMNTR